MVSRELLGLLPPLSPGHGSAGSAGMRTWVPRLADTPSVHVHLACHQSWVADSFNRRASVLSALRTASSSMWYRPATSL
jgi:hypothetical protein